MLAAHDTSTVSRGDARRQPETTVLYRVVRDHLPTLLDHARDRSEHGFGYPRFVERELEKFLACGLLCRGFVRVRCGDCAEERLVAFSCKTRGFCPSCTSRRMADTGAHLVDQVLPAVPYRHRRPPTVVPSRSCSALARCSTSTVMPMPCSPTVCSRLTPTAAFDFTQPLHSRTPWPTHRAASSPRGRSHRRCPNGRS